MSHGSHGSHGHGHGHHTAAKKKGVPVTGFLVTLFVLWLFMTSRHPIVVIIAIAIVIGLNLLPSVVETIVYLATLLAKAVTSVVRSARKKFAHTTTSDHHHDGHHTPSSDHHHDGHH